MNTWSCKSAIGGLALLSLGACDGGVEGGFLAGLGGTKETALSQARIAFGAVNLVPPRGFCIDGASLKQRFALMARCDKLGVPSVAAGAPVGLITVSFSDAAEAALPSVEAIATALDVQPTGEPRESAESVIFRAEGEPPLPDLDRRHWRGTALVGGQIMGIAVYGPQEGRAAGQEGLGLVIDLIAETEAGADT